MSDGDNMPMIFEKARVNVWHIGGIFFAVATNAALVGVVWNDTKRDIADTQSDVAKMQNDVTNIQSQLPQIAALQFQVTRAVEQIAENREGLKQVNMRADRIVESLGGKLDTVIDSVNKLATRVEVINSKLEDSARTDRTRFNMPILKR